MNYHLLSSTFLFSIILFACKKSTDPGPAPVVTAPVANARIHYVSTTGDDSRSVAQAKNQATPWKTIQKAATTISPGDTVIIFGGVYQEKVTFPATCNGTAGERTVFKNKEGESVVIDGGGAGVIWEGLLNFSSNSYITIRGIKVQNVYWYGFDVDRSDNITIDSCSTFNTGASGIYCSRGSAISIFNNNVRQACQRPYREPNGNGTQECITVAASNNFLVSKNEVWDSVIPGDAGGEGIDAKGGSFNGEISNNYIHDIVPLGIYVDAGSGEEYNIRVFGNRVFRTGGMAVAGELGGHAHEIYFYNNVIKDSKSTGFTFQSIGNGKYTNIYIVNNTFYNNATSGNFVGEVGNYSNNSGNSNIQIRNNIFFNKGTNYKFTIWHNIAASHVISNNLYFDFKPSNNSVNSFGVGNLTPSDIRDLDPQFVNPQDNFLLQSSSPAINRAVPITLPSSATLLFTGDFNGKLRGSAWDIGAFEY